MGRESVSGQIGRSPKLAEKFRMTKKQFTLHKLLYVIVVTSILSGASGLHAEEKLPMSESFTATTKDFLSDPARTGSLVGSIIAGAAIANPLAPLLGSVAGFIIGKRSDYSDTDSDAVRRQAYANRSFIPDESTEVTSLTGLVGAAGEPSLAAAEPLISGANSEAEAPGSPAPTDQVVIFKQPSEIRTMEQRGRSDQVVTTDLPEQTEHAVVLGMDEEMEARINLQKQLAYACSNVEFSQALSSSCYYFSQ